MEPPPTHSNLEHHIEKIALKISEFESKREEYGLRMKEIEKEIIFLQGLQESLLVYKESEVDPKTILSLAIDILKKEVAPLHITSILFQINTGRKTQIKRATLESLLSKYLKNSDCEVMRIEPGVYEWIDPEKVSRGKNEAR